MTDLSFDFIFLDWGTLFKLAFCSPSVLWPTQVLFVTRGCYTFLHQIVDQTTNNTFIIIDKARTIKFAYIICLYICVCVFEYISDLHLSCLFYFSTSDNRQKQPQVIKSTYKIRTHPHPTPPKCSSSLGVVLHSTLANRQHMCVHVNLYTVKEFRFLSFAYADRSLF